VIALEPLAAHAELARHGVQLGIGIRDHVAHSHSPQAPELAAVHVVDIDGHASTSSAGTAGR
jgi:hypothetical protein